MGVIALLAICVAAVAAVPSTPSRFLGGNLVTIDKYPSSSFILHTWDGFHMALTCAGTIMNRRTILTAGHCMYYRPPMGYRIRVGSSYAKSGGEVLPVSNIIMYPDFDESYYHNDIAIVHVSVAITYNDYVRPSPIAGSLYNLGDNQAVWATGWGIAESNPDDQQIKDTQIWTVNEDLCKSHYGSWDAEITDEIVCTGWPQQDYSGQCFGVFGAGVYHSGVLVAVTTDCYTSAPTINTRVSSYSTWIQSNA